MSKYYDPEEVVQMLPLITAYCRDIRDSYSEAAELISESERLSVMTTLSDSKQDEWDNRKQEIKHALSSIQTRYLRWKKELKDMDMYVCSPCIGRIDVPISCSDTTACFIMLCINPETTEKYLEWHRSDEGFDDAKPYFLERTTNV